VDAWREREREMEIEKDREGDREGERERERKRKRKRRRGRDGYARQIIDGVMTWLPIVHFFLGLWNSTGIGSAICESSPKAKVHKFFAFEVLQIF
jgi:hypothetical protein